jgi:DNA-binding transcriptional LysR family regulator
VALLGNVPAEDSELLGWRYVFRSRMAIVLSEDDPRSKRKQLSLKELAADSFVSLSDDTFPGRRLFLQSMCRGQGFEAEITTECESIPLMIGCVAAGDGVGILPQHCQKFPHHGARFVLMKTPTVYADVIAIFRNEALGEDIAAVISALEVAGEAVAEA